VCDWGKRIPAQLNDMKMAIHVDSLRQKSGTPDPVSGGGGGLSLQATSRRSTVLKDKSRADGEDKGGDPTSSCDLLETATQAFKAILEAEDGAHNKLLRSLVAACSEDPPPSVWHGVM